MTTANTVNIGVNVSDNGTTAKATKSAEVLKKSYDAAAKSAASIKVAGDTAAVQKAKVIAAKAVGVPDKDTPGLRRGATGVGGGSDSKDFARQAQGLGGLVHVYATFAANIFAVTAAFTALSKAADYTNMVEGLNQLGAASGRNLGSMAKNMAKLSDGAISLKQAIEVTAQGSAAGMTSDQMDRMTMAAKRASQALGRDMGDSLSRLSRGIIKIEPELLDELGIMVRVDRASQDYARTLGKTTQSLSEFEKRQGFALAVLKQSEEKFGNINIDSNPYSKLSATFTNLLYTGGELLNKVLGPIAKFLGESPVALATIMASVIAMLVNKAIPALGQWKQGLLENAKLDEETAKRRFASAKEARVAQAKASLTSIENAAEQEYILMDKHQKKLQKRFQDGSKTSEKLKQADLSDRTRKILAADGSEAIKKSDIKTLRKEARVFDTADPKVSKHLREYASALDRARQAELAYASANEKLKIEAAKPISKYSTAGMNQTLYERAQRKAGSTGILAKASTKADTYGFAAAFASIGQGVDKFNAKNPDNKIGALNKGFLQLRGSIGLAAGALGKFASAFGYIGFIVAALVGAFQLLDSLLTTNAKEQENFTNSVDRMQTSLEGAGRTIDLISSKTPFERMSYESVQANANAINEVSSSLNKLIKDYQKVTKTQSVWSTAMDKISALWGNSNFQVLSRNIAESITTGVALATEGPAKARAEEQLSNLLNIPKSSLKNLNLVKQEAKKLSQVQQGAIAKILDQLSKDVNNPISKLKTGLDDLTQATKEYDNAVNALNLSDPMSRMAQSAVKGFNEMLGAIKDTSTGLTGIIELSKDFGKLKLLPEETALRVVEIGNSLKDSTDQIKNLEERIASYSAQRIDTRKKGSILNVSEDLKAIDKAEKIDKSKVASLKSDQADLVVDFRKALIDGAKHSAKLLEQGLSIALEKSSLTIKRSIISGLDTPGALKLESEYKQKEIDLGLKTLDSQVELMLSQERLRLAIEKNTLVAELNKVPVGAPEAATITSSISQLNAAQTFIKGLNAKNIPKEIDSTNPYLTPLKSATMGRDAQRAAAGADKMSLKVSTELAVASKESSMYLENTVDSEQKLLDLKKTELEFVMGLSEYKSLTLRSELAGVTAAQKSLDIKAVEHKIDVEAQKLKIRVNAAKENIKNPEDRQKEIAAAGEASLHAMTLLINERTRLKTAEKHTLTLSDQYAIIQDTIVNRALDIDLAQKRLSLEGEYITLVKEAGILSEYEGTKQQNIINLRNFQLEQEKDLLKLKAARDFSKTYLGAEHAQTKELTKQVTQREALNKYAYDLKVIQAQYNEELLKTENTLRNIERLGLLGNNVGKYLGALADDFNNKLGQMIKAAKSAGDTFNQGLISAIDTTIDKFFDAMQKSELTWDSMVLFARNALSDVFKDTASQLLKNAWKDGIKGIMGPSPIEKAAQDAADASKKLQERTAVATEKTAEILSGKYSGSTQSPSSTSVVGNTSNKMSNGIAPDGGADNSTAMDAAGVFEDAADVSKYTADLEASTAFQWNKTTTQFTSDFGRVLQGQMSAMEMFKGLISNLASTLLAGVNQIISAVAGGSSSSSGGLFEGLFKGIAGAIIGGVGGESFVGPATGSVVPNAVGGTAFSSPVVDPGAGIVKLNASGGIYSSPSLSAYSNSVVSSPTMFAFAKGAGVMGEAGPEAIMPLKRDSSGNLGIRGTSATTNNIEINISIENGAAGSSEDSGSITDSSAKQLGNIIKNVVSQELIKQTRPGGLLAR